MGKGALGRSVTSSMEKEAAYRVNSALDAVYPSPHSSLLLHPQLMLRYPSTMYYISSKVKPSCDNEAHVMVGYGEGRGRVAERKMLL